MAEVKKYLKVNGAQSVIKVLEVEDVKVNGDIITKDGEKIEAKDISVVTVSSEGTATEEVSYITVNGTEYKLAGAGVSAISFKIVESIEEVTEPNIIYLIKKETKTTKNVYDEYVLIDGEPEKIGDTQVEAYDDSAIKARLDAIEGKESEWDAKQDEISDLETIRSGAALGATALQTVPAEYATVTYVDAKAAEVEAKIPSLDDYATISYVDAKVADVESKIPSVPTVVSAFANDAGYLTEHQSLDAYATITYVDNKIAEVEGKIPDVSNFATVQYVNAEVATKQDIISDLETIRSGAALGATAVQKDGEKGLSDENYTAEDKALVESAVQPAGLTTYATIAYVENEVGAKQDAITESSKLSADLIQDGTVNYVFNDDVAKDLVESAQDTLLRIYYENDKLVFEKGYSGDSAIDEETKTFNARFNTFYFEGSSGDIFGSCLAIGNTFNGIGTGIDDIAGSYMLQCNISTETPTMGIEKISEAVPSVDEVRSTAVLTYKPEVSVKDSTEINAIDSTTETELNSSIVTLGKTLTEYNEVKLTLNANSTDYKFTADPSDIEVATPSNVLYFVKEDDEDPVFKSVELLTSTNNKDTAQVKATLQSAGTWGSVDCSFYTKVSDSELGWNTETAADLTDLITARFYINANVYGNSMNNDGNDFEYITIADDNKNSVYALLKDHPNVIKLKDAGGDTVYLTKDSDTKADVTYATVMYAHRDLCQDVLLYRLYIKFTLNKTDGVSNYYLYEEPVNPSECVAHINSDFSYNTDEYNAYVQQNAVYHNVFNWAHTWKQQLGHRIFNVGYYDESGNMHIVPLKYTTQNGDIMILSGIFQMVDNDGAADSYQLELAFNCIGYQAPIYTSGTMTTPGYYAVELYSDLCECKKLGGGDSLPEVPEELVTYKLNANHTAKVIELDSSYSSSGGTTASFTYDFTVTDYSTITLNLTQDNVAYSYTANVSDISGRNLKFTNTTPFNSITLTFNDDGKSAYIFANCYVTSTIESIRFDKDGDDVEYSWVKDEKELPSTDAVMAESSLICNRAKNSYALSSTMTSGTSYAYFTTTAADLALGNIALTVTCDNVEYVYKAAVSDIVQSSPNCYLYFVQDGTTMSGDHDNYFETIRVRFGQFMTGETLVTVKSWGWEAGTSKSIMFYSDPELSWKTTEKELPDTSSVEAKSILVCDANVDKYDLESEMTSGTAYAYFTIDNAITEFDNLELHITYNDTIYTYTAKVSDVVQSSPNYYIYLVQGGQTISGDTDPNFAEIYFSVEMGGTGDAYIKARANDITECIINDIRFYDDAELTWEAQEKELPEAPEDDGSYKLGLDINGTTVNYSWKADEKELPSTSELEEDSMLVYKVSSSEEFTVGGNTFDYDANIGSAKVYANSDENIITEDAEKVEVEITYGSSTLAYTATVEDPTAATLYFITSDDNDETFESVYMSPLAATLSFVYTVPKSTINIPNVDDCKVFDKAELTWETKEDTPVSPTTVTYDYITFIDWSSEIVESGNNYHLTDVTKSETVANALLLGKPVILIKDSTYYKVTCVQLQDSNKLYAICPIYSGIDTYGAARAATDIGFILDVSSDFLTKVFFGNN